MSGQAAGRGQTPAQTIGPFFHDALMRDVARDDLDPRRQAGSPVQVVGRVLDGAGEPVDDAMVEVWQASGAGRYTHPLDAWPEDVAGFVGFGRVASGADGSWRLTTAMPGAVPGRDGQVQAPHLNVQVFARGLLDRISTRIYFDGQPANDDDPVLASVPADRRATLVAVREPGSGDGGVPAYRFDIVLQGPSQTVFFDV